jgi:hypothetical protein
MIDCENEIFSKIAESVRTAFPSVFISGEYIKTPPKFPFVSLVEMSNTAYDRTQTSGSLENHASLMYEVNVYSNKTSGKKSECKAIATLIDNELATLGFSRTMLQPIPNMDDATIYRMTGRYTAVISKDKAIYRR